MWLIARNATVPCHSWKTSNGEVTFVSLPGPPPSQTSGNDVMRCKGPSLGTVRFENRLLMNHTNSATEGGLIVLLAEAQPKKVVSVRSTFERLRILERLVRVANGSDVLSYLHGEGIYSDRLNYPFPSLLLLSRKLPVLSGVAVLCCLRSEPRFEHLPVVLVSSSFTRAQIATATWMGAACCSHRESAEALMQAMTRARSLALRPEQDREDLSRLMLSGSNVQQSWRNSDGLMTVGLG